MTKALTTGAITMRRPTSFPSAIDEVCEQIMYSSTYTRMLERLAFAGPIATEAQRERISQELARELNAGDRPPVRDAIDDALNGRPRRW